MIHKDIILFSYSYYNDTRSFIRTLSYSNDTRGTSRIIFDISNKWNQCTCIERFMGDLVVYSNVEQRLRSAGQVCRRAVRTEKCRHLSRAGGHFLPWAWSSLGLAFKPGSHGWSYTSARSHFTFPQVLHFTFGTYIMIVQSNKFFFWKLSGYKLINGFASFILWKWLALEKLATIHSIKNNS